MIDLKRVAVFGATGSVGTQTLDIIRAHPDELEVCCLTAGSDVRRLSDAASEFEPDVTALFDAEKPDAEISCRPIFRGKDANVEALLASLPDLAVIAVSGMAGLPLLAACLENNIPTALANKEAIVSGAGVISRLREQSESPLYPLDSEHAALYQCLGDSFDTEAVRCFWITASGGPFLRWTSERIAAARPAEALAHPTWQMGKKITIDSASLANKGLEVIEAHYLFHMPADQIRVVVQPGSLIHSMVEFRDTSVLAQFAPPDMHVPIRRALLGPGAHDDVGTRPLDFWTLGSISFEKPDMERFPCLELAYAAAKEHLTAVYSAADEVAAHAFAEGALSFGAIPRVIERAMSRFAVQPEPDTIEEVLELDAMVREFARACLLEGGAECRLYG